MRRSCVLWTTKELRTLQELRVGQGLMTRDIVPHLPRHTASGIQAMCNKKGWYLPPDARVKIALNAASFANAHTRKVHSVVNVFKEGVCAACARPLDSDPCWITDRGPVCPECVNASIRLARYFAEMNEEDQDDRHTSEQHPAAAGNGRGARPAEPVAGSLGGHPQGAD